MPPPLDSDLLRHFLAVAKTGSVTRAAEVVGRTQSAVSMQIRRLEEVLGGAVFERLPRGVALTQMGRELLPYAERIHALLREAGEHLTSPRLSGTVRVGIVDEYVESVVPTVLAAFNAAHPEVDVSVYCDFSDRQVEALAQDRIDLAVIFDWEGTGAGEVICHDPTVWVTSLAHRTHECRPIPVGLYINSSWSRDYAAWSLDRAGLPWRLAFEADNSAALEKALISGLAIVPRARSTVPEGCRVLGAGDGFPAIDGTEVALLSNPRRSGAAISAMAEVLRAAFRPTVAARQADAEGTA